MDVLPMFPLGTVLLPGNPLPLQVFEPRYLAMLRDIAGGDGRFGVVLIERGFEVGGGDQRLRSAPWRRSSR
ncbi:LON peptidase substrate-binding domain-containing protein [Janibacter anophelis]|uniref:LON peptidase substrate-binding domain-containing protein n=1 Tax=Janibacter anophelis TaxID=319054 RepID=UPI0039EFE44F